MSALAVVIPVHNRLAFTRNCLVRLRQQTQTGFEVIVIDDGSTDGTSEMIRAEFPEVTLLYGDGNLWWSGATNLGVKVALENGALWILTLNDDTLPGPTFVEEMLRSGESAPGAVIGALSVDAVTGRLVAGGERMNWWKMGFENLLNDPANPRAGLVSATHLPGRGLLIPAAVFHRIGLFDSQHFPHYLADYDFTYRAGRHGFPVLCCYSAVLGIYPEASGDHDNRRSKKLSSYGRHLFHMKGGGNVQAFFWFAVKNCPAQLLPSCLLAGTARRIFGYPLDWIRETYNQRWSRDASYRKA